jgi:hypothetical protein
VSKSLITKAPSDRDTDLKLDNASDAIKIFEKMVDGTPGVLGLQAKVDMGDLSKKGKLTDALERITTFERERDTMQNFNRTVGPVYATSGYRSVPDNQKRDWALDWSLARVESPRVLENTVSGETAGKYVGHDRQLVSWQKRSPIGRQVVKLGRSTGWTQGAVNAVEAVFSAQDGTYNRNVSAWPVVTPYGFPFALPGDSGSVVFDAEDVITGGNWVGLLTAANMALGVGYFTPIELVLEDISTVTGCEIFEPSPFAI